MIKIDIEKLNALKELEFEDAVYQAALYYASLGIPILPLDENSKMLPRGVSGINYGSATTKDVTIKRWFGPDGKFRGGNVGIACGTSRGVMALDIDAKNVAGTTGIKELTKLLRQYGELPAGPMQRTPSGGYHYLYQWQEYAASSSNKVANGIDTRGGTADRCTGHIVAFPSKINGKTYEWQEGGEVPPMPAWIAAKLGEGWTNKSKPGETAESVLDIPIPQTRRMLEAIDVDDVSYEDWVKIGMALKSMYGDDGLEVWDEWSSTGSRRKERECHVRWKSFTEDGPVGFGTFAFLAKEAGWVPLPGDKVASNIDSVVEEAVLNFNKEYALVRMGKSVIIANFSQKRGISFLGMQAFYDLNMPKKIPMPSKNGFVEKQLADIWMASELRREYHELGLYPKNDCDTDVLNLWSGWGVKEDDKASCQKFLDHTQDIICAGHEEIYEWVMDWMADVVQNPRDVKGTAIILRGEEGCGKGAFADTFGKLFGKHYTHLVDSERLTGRFNSFLESNIIVFADEVIWPGDRKAANILKGIVSEKNIMVEQKGVDSVMIENMNRVIIASNEDWIVPAGPQSRRWLVLNVSPKFAKNKFYFDQLFEELDNGGRGALLHYLLNRRIRSNLRLAPITEGLIEQRKMSHNHDSLLHFLSEAVYRGTLDSIDTDAKMGDAVRWPRRVATFDLYGEYVRWCKERGVSNYDKLPMVVFIGNIEQYMFVVEGRTATVPAEAVLARAVKFKQGIEQEKDDGN